MTTAKNLQDNLSQAEEWVRRLRKWSERLESHPSILGTIAVLKYIPANGAQAARRKLESLLEEQPRPSEEVTIEGESQQHPEKYKILLAETYTELTIITRKDHRVLVAGNKNQLTVDHGEDESEIFYPKMREKMENSFEIDWPANETAVIDTYKAINILFSAELERARSTLRWANQEQATLLGPAEL